MSDIVGRVIDFPVLVLVGPTASGKTGLALKIAAQFNCEVVSVDSMQVYRHMDIGTAKPTPAQRAQVAHHLIDIVEPDDGYDAARFVRDATAAIMDIGARHKIPLLTGGTGLYLKALLEGLCPCLPTNEALRSQLRERLRIEGRERLFYQLQQIDPASAARLHVNDTQRLLRALEIYQLTGTTWSEHLQAQQDSTPPLTFARLLLLGLAWEREILYQRIAERAGQMMAQGLLAEVERLLARGYDPQLGSMQAIGYRHATNLVCGIWDMETTMRLLVRDTRHYAKRQMTWFQGKREFAWYSPLAEEAILARIGGWLHS